MHAHPHSIQNQGRGTKAGKRCSSAGATPTPCPTRGRWRQSTRVTRPTPTSGNTKRVKSRRPKKAFQKRRSATKETGSRPIRSAQRHIHATQRDAGPSHQTQRRGSPRKIGAKIIHHQMRCARQTDVGHRRIADERAPSQVSPPEQRRRRCHQTCPPSGVADQRWICTTRLTTKRVDKGHRGVDGAHGGTPQG